MRRWLVYLFAINVDTNYICDEVKAKPQYTNGSRLVIAACSGRWCDALAYANIVEYLATDLTFKMRVPIGLLVRICSSDNFYSIPIFSAIN